MKRWFWVLDLIVVVSFAVIGRGTHRYSSDWGEVFRISTPFLIALAIAVIVQSRWLRSALPGLVSTSITAGLWFGSITVVGGLLLRRFVFDDGTASVFILVTTAWIIGLMVGWRLALTGVHSIASKKAS